MSCLGNLFYIFGTCSGASFEDLRCILDLHRPRLVLLECSPLLVQTGTPGETSDSDYIVTKCQELGYWAEAVVIDAKDYGAQVRIRASSWKRISNVGDVLLGMFCVMLMQHAALCSMHDGLKLLL